MRVRVSLLAIATGLLVPVPSATAIAARTVRAPYVTPGGVSGITAGETVVNGASYGAVTIRTMRGERTIGVSVADETGLPVAAELAQDTDGDGANDRAFAAFCGKAHGIAVPSPGRPVVVYIQAGTCGTGAISAPTRGTVTATLYRS